MIVVNDPPLVVGGNPRYRKGDTQMEQERGTRIGDLVAIFRVVALARGVSAASRWRPMRHIGSLRLMAAAPALALVVAACSASVDGFPASTYVPAASPSAGPAMSMSPDPSKAPASASPSASGSASAAPGAAGGTASPRATLHLSARNIEFDTDHLEAPTAQAFVIEFDNNDPGIPHNVEIKDAIGASVFKGQVISGPATASYQVPALIAGDYTFLCDVHPTMSGTLTMR